MKRVALAVVCALVISGCASIPTEGPVNLGSREVREAEPFFPMAEGPRPGDGPTMTVRRFLYAAAAGVASDFSVAREYLSAEASVDWNPAQQVTVYSSAALLSEEDLDAGVIRYRVPVVAVIDSQGRMREGMEGERADLEFTVTEDASGRWRISGLDNGVVISESFLNSFYRPVELVFASPDRTTVVTELRWLPINNIATVAAKELLAGPSPWLADAAVTGFPAGASLDVEAVVVENNVATVALNPLIGGTAANRELMVEQLRLTLTALPNVQEVDITMAGLPLVTEPTLGLRRAPVPDAEAAAIVGDRLGAWDGSTLWAVPDQVGRLPSDARGLALSYDGQWVAMVTGGSLAVTSALASGVDGLVEADQVDPAASVAVMDLATVWSGQRPLDPSFDIYGWLWSIDANNPLVVVAIDPAGEVMELSVPSLEGREVQAVSVSRDGSKIVVASSFGSQQLIEVAGISRGLAGAPLQLGEPVSVGTGVGHVKDLAWLDQATVAALGVTPEVGEPTLWVITVGGRTSVIETLGAVSVTARNGERTLTVVSDEGDVRVRSGAAWSTQGSGVREIAYAG